MTTAAQSSADASGMQHTHRMPAALVVGNRHLFREVIAGLLASGKRQIALDFTDTEYVDSSGLGVLVTAHRNVRQAGGELVMMRLSDEMRRCFEVSKMDQVFTIRSDG